MATKRFPVPVSVRSPVRLAVLILGGACARAAPALTLDPTRFEAEIQAFEAADRATPPTPGWGRLRRQLLDQELDRRRC